MSAVDSGGFSYSGRDNLEAMRLAVRYNAFLVDLIGAHAAPVDRILDFGAGLGLFAEALRARGHQVSCLEVDDELARGLADRGFRAVRSPDELADSSIDYLYSLNVLEHIDDEVAALSALMPKLRRGARCLIYVPAFPILYSAMDRLVGHHRRYTAGSLRAALEGAGLSVERVEYADCLGFPASLAYRMLGGDGTLSPASVVAYDRWAFPASRAIDRLTRRWFGKNVFAVARKR
ncbi:class I SAM-dependent methyltransferase [Burkholderiaceae bacterium FT117]|uniref:class I SAM-dependent methyltransferase n=1 Tax=Zeimonas sediminis TaxID=2944268 RepID=UPI0023431687|nr:methyltransferase domain-containing protein [Zeimonas sediminis]MCM5572095.1 class I SAM-dependent methyltransferase [Zeimonas sediminis]